MNQSNQHDRDNRASTEAQNPETSGTKWDQDRVQASRLVNQAQEHAAAAHFKALAAQSVLDLQPRERNPDALYQKTVLAGMVLRGFWKLSEELGNCWANKPNSHQKTTRMLWLVKQSVEALYRAEDHLLECQRAESYQDQESKGDGQ